MVKTDMMPLSKRQHQNNKYIDTCKNISILPAGSTLGVHWEYEGPWMHGTIVGHGSYDYQGRCYKI